MSHKLNHYFQAGLDVMDQPCLVIGGGREAEEKSGRLLDAGAHITVVSPALTPTLAEWVSAGRSTHPQRGSEDTDLDGVFLPPHTIKEGTAPPSI